MSDALQRLRATSREEQSFERDEQASKASLQRRLENLHSDAKMSALVYNALERMLESTRAFIETLFDHRAKGIELNAPGVNLNKTGRTVPYTIFDRNDRALGLIEFSTTERYELTSGGVKRVVRVSVSSFRDQVSSV
jgi:hypothetical protein